MKSRVVVMDLSVENVTDDVINFYPGMFIFVAEEINGSNGVSSVNQGETHIIFLPNETKEIQLQVLLCPGQISEKKLDKIESSTLTLVYSFYPYRRKIVFG
jgi:hypothetical protein